MPYKPTPKDKRIEREQGDVNTTANRRRYWERNLSERARQWFDEDQEYFLHQSLSTPVLNVLSRADGIYIEAHQLCEHAARLGEYTIGRLNELKEKHPLIGHVAGLGLHIGIDLVSDRKAKTRAVDEAEMIMFKCLEKGLSAKTIEGNVLTLRPALIISRDEMDRAVDIIDEALGEVEAGKGY